MPFHWPMFEMAGLVDHFKYHIYGVLALYAILTLVCGRPDKEYRQ